jgi:hypothetical protein
MVIVSPSNEASFDSIASRAATWSSPLNTSVVPRLTSGCPTSERPMLTAAAGEFSSHQSISSASSSSSKTTTSAYHATVVLRLRTAIALVGSSRCRTSPDTDLSLLDAHRSWTKI